MERRTNLFPPRRFLTFSSGLGSAFVTLLGFGLASLSISFLNFPNISSPNLPSGELPAISILAASATFAPTLRCAFMRSSRRVSWTMGEA